MTRWIALLLSTLLMGCVLQAQESTPESETFQPPLVAYFNGDVYRMDSASETLIPYESCQPDEDISGTGALSPAGTHFTFSTLTKQASQALRELGGFGGAPLPVNLWLCDMQTNTLTRFFVSAGADQPLEGDLPMPDRLRGAPVWSPDGSELTWSELSVEDNQTAFIARYDLATGNITRTEIELPPTLGVPAAPGIARGENGIYIFVFQLNEETFDTEDYVYVFDVEMNAVAAQTLIESSGETDDFVVDRVLVQRDGREYFALRYLESGWELVDPLTGQREEAGGLPGLVARNADASRVLLLDIDETYNYNWQLQNYTDASGDPFVLTGTPPQRIAPGPDGERFAYADSTLHIWQNGQTTDIAASDGFADDPQAFVLWGAEDIVITQAADIAEKPLPTCDGTQQSRLRPGDTARVVENTVPNNVRTNPTLQAELVGQLPGGTTFGVLDGPVCNDGYAWYEVTLNSDITGWTAEGSADTYWLAPAAADADTSAP
jgi:hypothetical protein